MADNGTVIGENIRITGHVSGEEDLTVFGWVEGTVELSHSLHVEPSGIIKANVSVATAVVSGVVVGNITASTAVELLEGGRMVGNIIAPRVVIADGAAFRGHIDMGDVDAPEATASTSGSARSGRSSTPRRSTARATPARASRPSRPAARKEEPAAEPAKAPAKAPAKKAAAEKKKAPAAKPAAEPVAEVVAAPAKTTRKKKAAATEAPAES